MEISPFGNVLNQFANGATPEPNKYTESWQRYTESLRPKPTDSTQFLGSEFGYLKDLLKKNVEGDNPIFDKIFGNASRKIGASTDRNVQDIKEMGAQSGFRGAGGNLVNEAYKGEQESLGSVSDSLALQETSYIQNALAQLLGLNSQEGQTAFSTFQSDRSQSQFDASMAENKRQFNEQLAAQKEASETDFWDVVSGILGTATGGFAGGLGGKAGSKWV